ncbi:MAG: hypothetical protein ACYDH9_04845 [Limisphaerales bacterium]
MKNCVIVAILYAAMFGGGSMDAANVGSAQSLPTGKLVSEPANLPPSVWITTPGSGNEYCLGATIHIKAAATDPDGSIAQGSSNLVDWVPVQTNLATTNFWDFVDPASSNYFRRFYRCLLAP